MSQVRRPAGNTAEQPMRLHCVCSTCFTPQPFPQPGVSTMPYQCSYCRLHGVDMKILYTRRSFPTEHSTR
ncbi:unnamed protein product [Phytomonas sp. EM1]|nr:unnamed protein product [Phytomonas sp. EM1]|eukprot:CCW59822.1 unnamed protein product [Phytomonas sp. isolate EM1]